MSPGGCARWGHDTMSSRRQDGRTTGRGAGPSPPPGRATVKAIVQDSYGSADRLELRDIDKPVPGDDGVVVEVHAAGLDPGVWHLMTGRPYLVRAMGFGIRAPKFPVRGGDLAGIVESVGKNATRFKPGDQVYGTCDGSFAEYALTDAERIAPMPANLDFRQAAAVPVSGVTALVGLRDAGRVQAGQTVLVIGAAGGVGSYAVQLAKAFGAVVTGVCSTPKADLVLIGGEGGGRWLGGFQRQIFAPLRSVGSKQRLVGLVVKQRQEHLMTLKELIEAGKVTPVVDRTYPLSDAADAIRYLERGHAGGKV